MKKRAMVVGGSNGIGMALVLKLINKGYDKVVVADRVYPELSDEKIEYVPINLINGNYDVFDNYRDIDTLIITAGFGRVSSFEDILDGEIVNSFKVNAISPVAIIKKYYNKLLSDEDFNCAVMGSISGLVSSPLFSVYAATKAAICRFAESINVELEKSKSKNRILNVSPGSIKGTKFNGGVNDFDLLDKLAGQIIDKMENKCELFIPDYDEVFKRVIDEYKQDAHQFGVKSYDYKVNNNRISDKPQLKIGYLSGTFDLFHIGHINLLGRAKQYCDYLIVGVHESGNWKGKETFIPFEERKEIVASCKYVDKVIKSEPEDCDVWDDYHYNYLFVGSDYKGSERFERYEKYFEDKDVEIIYFPYTQGTSSTKLRAAIEKNS